MMFNPAVKDSFTAILARRRGGSKYQKKWEEIKFLNTNSSRQIGLFSSAGNITMLAQNCYRPNFDF